jgi:hypothetical protein
MFCFSQLTIPPSHSLLYLGIIHAFNCHYRKHLILKTVATVGGGLLQDAPQMKLGVLSAVHLIAEPWRLITPTTIQNCFVKCGFSSEHVSSNDDSAVKLNEDEEDDWHSLQPLGVQSEDYPTCDSALEICQVWGVDQVLGQHLTMPEEETEEEVAEHKATLLDGLKGLEAARKYIHQFDTKNSIIVMCNKVENELYKLRAQEEKKQRTLIELLKK